MSPALLIIVSAIGIGGETVVETAPLPRPAGQHARLTSKPRPNTVRMPVDKDITPPKPSPATTPAPIGKEIRFPDAAGDPTPAPPKPAPTPVPIPVTNLGPSQLYVIDSDVKCIVLGSPIGLVTVTQETGPVKIRGTFVDGNGQAETRTYKGSQVTIIEASGVGVVELIVVPEKASGADDVIRKTITVDSGTGPRPPPGPGPGPTPPIPPGPSPTGKMGDHGFVCVIEETADLVKNRRAIFLDKDLNAYMKAHNHSWRSADKDVHRSLTDPNPPDDLAPRIAKSKGKKLPQVFLIDSNGNDVDQFDCPASAAELLARIKAAGG